MSASKLLYDRVGRNVLNWIFRSYISSKISFVLYDNETLCGAGLSSRLARSREVRAIDTKMTSASVHSFVWLFIGSSIWCYDLTNNIDIRVNFARIKRCTQFINDKMPTGLNGLLSIRDYTLTSCQKGSYLHSNNQTNKWSVMAKAAL